LTIFDFLFSIVVEFFFFGCTLRAVDLFLECTLYAVELRADLFHNAIYRLSNAGFGSGITALLVYFDRKKDMEDAGARVAQNIRYLREQRGLSQEKLSFLADLHRVYIGQIERGEKSPTLLTLQKIADALGVEVRELL
jgi:DNA-binding XRE family transcriptional regulator